MTPKHQFGGGHKPRSFFDRKVRPEGSTRVLSMGKIIPEGWEYVRLKIVRQTDEYITVRIMKLYGVEKPARTKGTDKADKQNSPESGAASGD